MNNDNQKFEITDIAHEKYPFLHRIRALRDVGATVKAGDLGGFVEHEGNLSYEDEGSWLYDDAIAANGAFVYEGAVLRDHAVACGEARVCKGAVMSGCARAEDHAHIDGAVMGGGARVSGAGTVFAMHPRKVPVLNGNCVILGHVTGNVRITGEAVVLTDEKIANLAIDTVVVSEKGRSIQRSPDRDKLVPSAEYFGRIKPKQKRREEER